MRFRKILTWEWRSCTLKEFWDRANEMLTHRERGINKCLTKQTQPTERCSKTTLYELKFYKILAHGQLGLQRYLYKMQSLKLCSWRLCSSLFGCAQMIEFWACEDKMIKKMVSCFTRSFGGDKCTRQWEVPRWVEPLHLSDVSSGDLCR